MPQKQGDWTYESIQLHIECYSEETAGLEMICLTKIWHKDLEGVEKEVTEEANEAQQGAFRDGLVDDEGEEDGVDPQQRDESQSGLR